MHAGMFCSANRLAPATIFLAATALLVALSGQAASAQSADAEERCKGDVMRLCSEFVPDEDAIVGCLKAKRLALTSSCLNALSPPEVQLPSSRSPLRTRRTITPAEASRSTRVYQ